MKRSKIIFIAVVLPLIVGVGVLILILVEKDKTSLKLPDIETPVGYQEEFLRVTEEGVEARYDVVSHGDENIQRVVDNVDVKIVEYDTPEEAQKQITDASLVYIWEWRKENIAGQEASTGFLRDREQTRYEAAYLAWTEGNTYFELIARADDIRDFSDKEFLWQSAKEVAESILGGVY